ncbi:hypothetical protein CONLIGDRAFT_692315 [Coniochaeta ligniaria NRRL 30616]|uniref:HNH nuclease domain-containing protein n=1 Tax=Coniochaeta ligniaria NRRL 30616 TaxID=1408157 RepID=A0A1J7J6L0_9PEZI|nr:hypothetical protein CONLIGDRAFT_692315 [Coniochaeta ligniaria NRRL 30616]
MSTKDGTPALAAASSEDNSPTASLMSHSSAATHPAISAQSDLSWITDTEMEELDMEHTLNQFSSPTGEQDAGRYRVAGILLAFYQNLGQDGKKILATEVKNYAPEPEKMLALANHLVTFLLVPFYATGVKGSQSAGDEQVFPDAAAEIANSMAWIEPSVRDQKPLRRDCLRRDNFRCVFSGAVDDTSVVDGKTTRQPGEQIIETECAHVIPFSFGSFDAQSSSDTEAKATIWWTLYRYFPILAGKIGADTINQRENAVTLMIVHHKRFGKMRLRFRPVEGRRNTYETILADMYTDQPISATKSGSSIIELEQYDDTVPMPSAEYFRTHCTIAEILEVTGLGEEMWNIISEAVNEDEAGPVRLGDVVLIFQQKFHINKVKIKYSYLLLNYY